MANIFVKKCISHLMKLILYSVTIYSHLLIFTIILHRLWSNVIFIFNLLPVNLLLIAIIEVVKVWSTENLCTLLLDVTANDLVKVAFSFISELSTNQLLFNSITNHLIISINCYIRHSI